MAHLMFCLHRLPGLTREQFQAHWRNVHGPLVLRHAQALGLARYVQSHAGAESDVAALAQARGAPPGFDGIAQLWWEARAFTAEEKAAARAASAVLLEDERRFIDLSRSPLLLVQDHELLHEYVTARSG